MLDFHIGVDGGGSGTRAVLARPDGTPLGHGQAGPSALGQGIAQAWTHILQAAHAAFLDAGLSSHASNHALPLVVLQRCALGAGLSGANHRPWAEAFIGHNPGFARLVLDSDATTLLLGAHSGRPGAIVAAGTGTVGDVLHPDGTRAQASGWGFAVGDEGSGAWLGLRAVALAQNALDGRTQSGPLAHSVLQRCTGLKWHNHEGTIATELASLSKLATQRAALLSWCASAKQFEYAQLATLVFDAAPHDVAARDLLAQAADALETVVRALDPSATLPLVVCGSVGQRLQTRLSRATQDRCVAPDGDGTLGALRLLGGVDRK